MPQCLFCKHENPEGARFCQGCGAEMRGQCSNCHRAIPADARYCAYCGQPVLAAPHEPWYERITPEQRLALFVACRSMGITLIILAMVLVVVTPPPGIFDEAVLLLIGGGLLVLAQIIQPGGKPKPPGGDREIPPDSIPPEGLELPVEEVVTTEAISRQVMEGAGRFDRELSPEQVEKARYN